MDEKSNDKKIITKIEAVREQLETAIKLFFRDESPVSVHTLSSAAYTILRNLSAKNNGSFALEIGELEARIKPEYLKEWRDKVNAAANFFKHADSKHRAGDSEPSSTLEFNERINEFKLLQCCSGYREFAGKRTPTMNAYLRWMMTFHSNLFVLSEEEAATIRASHEAPGDKPQTYRERKQVGMLLVAQELLSSESRASCS